MSRVVAHQYMSWSPHVFALNVVYSVWIQWHWCNVHIHFYVSVTCMNITHDNNILYLNFEQKKVAINLKQQQRTLLNSRRFCVTVETFAFMSEFSCNKSEKCVSAADANSFSTEVDSVYPRPLCCFVCASTLALHFVVPAVTSHLRDMDMTWSVYLFNYPDRSFLIVYKQLHTSTTLITLCFSISFFLL